MRGSKIERCCYIAIVLCAVQVVGDSDSELAAIGEFIYLFFYYNVFLL